MGGTDSQSIIIIRIIIVVLVVVVVVDLVVGVTVAVVVASRDTKPKPLKKQLLPLLQWGTVVYYMLSCAPLQNGLFRESSKIRGYSRLRRNSKLNGNSRLLLLLLLVLDHIQQKTEKNGFQRVAVTVDGGFYVLLDSD